jgi:uncharacterized membrane protein YraQ (UPF0718 family)
MVTIVVLIVSFVKDKDKTVKGVKKGFKKFKKILPKYLYLLILISVVLLLSEDLIVNYLSQENTFLGLGMSLGIGSITMMPGFIAYPLAGILMNKGVPFIILSGFVTSLMLVGVVTFPVEKEYFGTKATIYRNIFSFLVALGIAVGTGLYYGEVF